jgi:hypothetical protein
MIFALLQDFAEVLDTMPREPPRRRLLALLDEALRRDVHLIDRHPTTLFQCLWNSCWWYDCPAAAQHYTKPDEGWPPSGPPWESADPRLFKILEGGRADKEQATPEFCWLRSLRPPPDPLGGPRSAVFIGHQSGVLGVAIAPDGQTIYSVSYDYTVRVWDDSKERVRWDIDEVRTSLTLAPDGTQLATAAGIVDVRDGNWVCRFLDRARGMHVVGTAFAPDGRTVAVAGGENYVVQVYDAKTGAERMRLRHPHWSYAVAFSPDGVWLATGGAHGSVRLWDARTGEPGLKLEAHSASQRVRRADGTIAVGPDPPDDAPDDPDD